MSSKHQHLQIFVFITIVFLFLLLTHWVVYSAIVTMFSITSWQTLLTLRILAVLSPLSFIGVSVLSAKYNNILVRFLYKSVMTGIGLFVYLFLASLVYGLTISVYSYTDNVGLLPWFGISLIVISVAASIYGLFHAREPKIKNVKLPLPNLPEIWKGRKAVWISDIHLGHIRGSKFAEKIVKMVNEIDPDIIFIGGDLFDGVKVNEREIIAPFAKMYPSLGTYFVTGNHEEFSEGSHFTRAITEVGIKVLDDELVIIDGLQILGLPDHDSIDKIRFPEILNKLMVDKSRPSILLKHQPSELEVAEAAGISIQISGHTHRAQMFPLYFITKLIYRGYDYGLKKFGNMQVYTSSGVGTWGPPMRVGTNGEIVVFEFV